MQKVNRKDVISKARTWLEVPWVHQGRTRHGVDCAGLIILVGHSLGLVDYDTTNYQRRTHGQDFLQHFRMNMSEKPLKEARPGDIILFRDSAYPCHSAVLGERNESMTIIHAHAPRRKVVEELLNQGDWLTRRVACFEFIGLED